MIAPELVAESSLVLQKHARTFRMASWFLPAAIRAEVAVVYAFCRQLDELADTEGNASALAEIADELRGAAARPLVAAYLSIAEKYAIPKHVAEDLLAGVRSDLHRVRVQDDAELRKYAYRVAGTVGWMMACMLGVRDPQALPLAVDLGIGMQLTNIARDVAEDARIDRIYLPERRLLAEGILPESLVQGAADREAVARVVRDVLTLAEVHYANADQGMRYLPWRARWAIFVAARGYRAIGRKLLAAGGDALAGRTVLTPLERFAAIVEGSAGMLGFGVARPGEAQCRTA